MRRSAILCPGPTLRKTIPDDWDLFEEVVAVTDGIFADAPITAWSFQEGPGHPHQERYQRYHARLEELALPVWCVKGSRDRWIHKWRIPEERVFDEFSIQELVAGLPYKSKKWWSKARNDVRPFGGSSMFYALARLLLEGSKDIHIYGADMDGCGNFDPRNGKAEPNTRHPDWWRDRWVLERNLLLDLMEEAGPKGVSILVYKAEYDIEESKAEHFSDVDGWL